MPAGHYDFIIEQGAQFYRVIQWRDSSGALVPMANYMGAMKIRRFPESQEVLLELKSGGSFPTLFIGSTDGLITLYVPASITKDLDFIVGRYDLELYPPFPNHDKVIRLLEGKVTLDREVTR